MHPGEDPHWYGADAMGGSFASLSGAPTHSNALSNAQSQASVATFGVGFVPPTSCAPGARGGALGGAGWVGPGSGVGGPTDGAPWDDRVSDRSFAFQGLAASPSDSRQSARGPGVGLDPRGSVDTTGAPYLRQSTSPPVPHGSGSTGTPPAKTSGAAYAGGGAAGGVGGAMGASGVPGRGSGRAGGSPGNVPGVATGSVGSIGSVHAPAYGGGRGGALGGSMGAASSAGGGGGGAASSSSLSVPRRMTMQYAEDDLCFHEDSERLSHSVDNSRGGSTDVSNSVSMSGTNPMAGMGGMGIVPIQKYPLKTVQIATQGYSKANLLGDWGYGRVYVVSGPLP